MRMEGKIISKLKYWIFEFASKKNFETVIAEYLRNNNEKEACLESWTVLFVIKKIILNCELQFYDEAIQLVDEIYKLYEDQILLQLYLRLNFSLKISHLLYLLQENHPDSHLFLKNYFPHQELNDENHNYSTAYLETFSQSHKLFSILLNNEHERKIYLTETVPIKYGHQFTAITRELTLKFCEEIGILLGPSSFENIFSDAVRKMVKDQNIAVLQNILNLFESLDNLTEEKLVLLLKQLNCVDKSRALIMEDEEDSMELEPLSPISNSQHNQDLQKSGQDVLNSCQNIQILHNNLLNLRQNAHKFMHNQSMQNPLQDTGEQLHDCLELHCLLDPQKIPQNLRQDIKSPQNQHELCDIKEMNCLQQNDQSIESKNMRSFENYLHLKPLIFIRNKPKQMLKIPAFNPSNFYLQHDQNLTKLIKNNPLNSLAILTSQQNQKILESSQNISFKNIEIKLQPADDYITANHSSSDYKNATYINSKYDKLNDCISSKDIKNSSFSCDSALHTLHHCYENNKTILLDNDNVVIDNLAHQLPSSNAPGHQVATNDPPELLSAVSEQITKTSLYSKPVTIDNKAINDQTQATDDESSDILILSSLIGSSNSSSNYHLFNNSQSQSSNNGIEIQTHSINVNFQKSDDNLVELTPSIICLDSRNSNKEVDIVTEISTVSQILSCDYDVEMETSNPSVIIVDSQKSSMDGISITDSICCLDIDSQISMSNDADKMESLTNPHLHQCVINLPSPVIHIDSQISNNNRNCSDILNLSTAMNEIASIVKPNSPLPNKNGDLATLLPFSSRGEFNIADISINSLATGNKSLNFLMLPSSSEILSDQAIVKCNDTYTLCTQISDSVLNLSNKNNSGISDSQYTDNIVDWITQNTNELSGGSVELISHNLNNIVNSLKQDRFIINTQQLSNEYLVVLSQRSPLVKDNDNCIKGSEKNISNKIEEFKNSNTQNAVMELTNVENLVVQKKCKESFLRFSSGQNKHIVDHKQTFQKLDCLQEENESSSINQDYLHTPLKFDAVQTNISNKLIDQSLQNITDNNLGMDVAGTLKKPTLTANALEKGEILSKISTELSDIEKAIDKNNDFENEDQKRGTEVRMLTSTHDSNSSLQNTELPPCDLSKILGSQTSNNYCKNFKNPFVNLQYKNCLSDESFHFLLVSDTGLKTNSGVLNPLSSTNNYSNTKGSELKICANYEANVMDFLPESFVTDSNQGSSAANLKNGLNDNGPGEIINNSNKSSNAIQLDKISSKEIIDEITTAPVLDIFVYSQKEFDVPENLTNPANFLIATPSCQSGSYVVNSVTDYTTLSQGFDKINYFTPITSDITATLQTDAINVLSKLTVENNITSFNNSNNFFIAAPLMSSLIKVHNNNDKLCLDNLVDHNNAVESSVVDINNGFLQLNNNEPVYNAKAFETENVAVERVINIYPITELNFDSFVNKNSRDLGSFDLINNENVNRQFNLSRSPIFNDDSHYPYPISRLTENTDINVETNANIIYKDSKFDEFVVKNEEHCASNISIQMANILKINLGNNNSNQPAITSNLMKLEGEDHFTECSIPDINVNKNFKLDHLYYIKKQSEICILEKKLFDMDLDEMNDIKMHTVSDYDIATINTNVKPSTDIIIAESNHYNVAASSETNNITPQLIINKESPIELTNNIASEIYLTMSNDQMNPCRLVPDKINTSEVDDMNKGLSSLENAISVALNKGLASNNIEDITLNNVNNTVASIEITHNVVCDNDTASNDFGNNIHLTDACIYSPTKKLRKRNKSGYPNKKSQNKKLKTASTENDDLLGTIYIINGQSESTDMLDTVSNKINKKININPVTNPIEQIKENLNTKNKNRKCNNTKFKIKKLIGDQLYKTIKTNNQNTEVIESSETNIDSIYQIKSTINEVHDKNHLETTLAVEITAPSLKKRKIHFSSSPHLNATSSIIHQNHTQSCSHLPELNCDKTNSFSLERFNTLKLKLKEVNWNKNNLHINEQSNSASRVIEICGDSVADLNSNYCIAKYKKVFTKLVNSKSSKKNLESHLNSIDTIQDHNYIFNNYVPAFNEQLSTLQNVQILQDEYDQTHKKPNVSIFAQESLSMQMGSNFKDTKRILSSNVKEKIVIQPVHTDSKSAVDQPIENNRVLLLEKDSTLIQPIENYKYLNIGPIENTNLNIVPIENMIINIMPIENTTFNVSPIESDENRYRIASSISNPSQYFDAQAGSQKDNDASFHTCVDSDSDIANVNDLSFNMQDPTIVDDTTSESCCSDSIPDNCLPNMKKFIK